MSVYFIIIIGVFFLYVSGVIFKRWLNPLSLLTIIWMSMLALFELKLLHFHPLSAFTWTVIIASYLSFFLGCLTIFLWEYKFNDYDINKYNPNIDVLISYKDGKIIRNITIIFSLIGLYGALQHWSILLEEFGDITGILLHAAKVYHLRQTGEIKGVVPYVWLFSFFGAFFAGIYMAYKGKFTFIALLPILGIILKDLAKVARNGILIGMLEFFLTYFFFRFFLSKSKERTTKKKKMIFSVVIIVVLMITAVSLIKLFRNPQEEYVTSGSSLASYKGDILISPHLYFYAASQVGVLNRYLEEANEDMPWGSSTFATFYNMLSSAELIEKVNWRQKPYHIPQWSNTATYLRDFYNDFGIYGVLLGPYLLAVLCSYFWFYFFKHGKLKTLLILVQLNVIVGLSFFVLALRSPTVTLFFFFVYPLILLLENILSKRRSV